MWSGIRRKDKKACESSAARSERASCGGRRQSRNELAIIASGNDVIMIETAFDFESGFPSHRIRNVAD